MGCPRGGPSFIKKWRGTHSVTTISQYRPSGKEVAGHSLRDYYQPVQALWREFLAFLVAIDYAWDALGVGQVSSL